MATGEHPDFILIDDPLSADQARSDAERNAVVEHGDGKIIRGADEVTVEDPAAIEGIGAG